MIMKIENYPFSFLNYAMYFAKKSTLIMIYTYSGIVMAFNVPTTFDIVKNRKYTYISKYVEKDLILLNLHVHK